MNNTEILYILFAETLKIDLSVVNDELKYQGIPQWDSLSHLNLIISIEDRFNVSLAMDDIRNLNSVGKAKEILTMYNIIF